MFKSVTRTFAGKTVVIAGGASGIGRELALQLAGLGAVVAVGNRAGASLDTFRREIQDGSFAISIYEVDMVLPPSVDTFVQHVIKDLGNIDYFFNCVGIVQGGEVKDTPLSVIDNVTTTNSLSVLYGTHFVYRQMLGQGHGHIVNIASAAGLLPTPVMAFYTATKYGIVGFSHALRAEASSLGVRVSVVCPGFIKTPIYEKSAYSNLDKAKTIRLLFRRFPIQSPEQAVTRIVRGVANNRTTIHTWYSLRAVWLFYRLFPNAYIGLAGQLLKVARRRLEIAKTTAR